MWNLTEKELKQMSVDNPKLYGQIKKEVEPESRSDNEDINAEITKLWAKDHPIAYKIINFILKLTDYDYYVSYYQNNVKIVIRKI